MKVKISEPIKAYMADTAVQSAVSLLLKNGSDKRVGIEESAPYSDQSEYRSAWLASREIYVEWHALLERIWHQVWLQNAKWDGANLSELTTLEVKAEQWELPTLHNAWHEEWFGRIYRTNRGKLIGLYVYADIERVHLNFHAPKLRPTIDGWEPDEGDFDSIEVAVWGEDSVDLVCLELAASNLLAWLRGE